LTSQDPELYWDATYAIAMSLMASFPHLDPVLVGLEELAGLVQSLPGFCDDPELVNERILLDIQLTWFEESTSL